MEDMWSHSKKGVHIYVLWTETSRSFREDPLYTAACASPLSITTLQTYVKLTRRLTLQNTISNILLGCLVILHLYQSLTSCLNLHALWPHIFTPFHPTLPLQFITWIGFLGGGVLTYCSKSKLMTAACRDPSLLTHQYTRLSLSHTHTHTHTHSLPLPSLLSLISLPTSSHKKLLSRQIGTDMLPLCYNLLSHVIILCSK